MGIRVKMDLTGKDEVYLARVEGYRKVLYSLDIFSSVPEHLSAERADQALEKYRTHYEAGKTGNRVEISQRNKARQEVTEFFKGLLHFLHCVATENDVPLILEGGLDLCKTPKRKGKRTPNLVVTGEGIS